MASCVGNNRTKNYRQLMPITPLLLKYGRLEKGFTVHQVSATINDAAFYQITKVLVIYYHGQTEVTSS